MDKNYNEKGSKLKSFYGKSLIGKDWSGELGPNSCSYWIFAGRKSLIDLWLGIGPEQLFVYVWTVLQLVNRPQ